MTAQFGEGMSVRFDPRLTGSCQFMGIVDKYQVVCSVALSHEEQTNYFREMG